MGKRYYLALLFVIVFSLNVCACSGNTIDNNKVPNSSSFPYDQDRTDGIKNHTDLNTDLNTDTNTDLNSDTTTNSNTDTNTVINTKSPTNMDNITKNEDLEIILESLTLEEKIGQLFFIASRYNANNEHQLSVDKALTDTLKQYKPGGFILFSENLESIDKTVKFIDDLQKNSIIPMFIGVDEEGGIVTRLNKAPQLHSTIMPSPYAIGLTNNMKYSYEASFAISEEVKSLGFNLNFAPVCDVFSNPKNKVIGKRAYSDDADICAQMVEEAVKGAKECGVIPVLKHFPGHGDTEHDSHTGAAIVEKNIDELIKTEFIPFEAGIKAGADMIMTAHVLTPNITGDNIPATLSKYILTDILREKLGFEGIIITDGLEMSAISAFYPEEEAVVMAIEAGVDILLLPKDFKKAYTAILSAVNNGRITEERIDESLKRILKLKNIYLVNATGTKLDPEKTLGSQEHISIAEKIIKEGKK